MASIYDPKRFQPREGLGYILSRVRKTYIGEVEKELAPYDISSSQWAVILNIADGRGGTAAELCKNMRYDPGAMSRDPNKLIETFKNMRPGAEAAAKILDTYLDQVLAHHNIEPNRLALLGFSQGTMMSLHVGLRREKQLAGILGFSGALLGGSKLGTALKSKPPVLLIHGDSDPVVPPQASVEAAKILKANGVPCETGFVQGLQHSIDGSGAQAGANFLRKHLV